MVDSVEYPPSFQMRNALLDGASDLIDTPAEIFFFMREGFLVLCIRAGVMWSARRFVDSGEKPEFIRTCEAKSLYHAGFDSLVKSLKNKSSRRFLRGLGR